MGTGVNTVSIGMLVSEMLANDFRKMILANEIKKCKARVGMSIVDVVSKNAEADYIKTLDDVIEKLQEAIDLLGQ